MLRCGRQGIETVIVVVEPYAPQARPQITLRALGQEFRFIGTILPTGAGIRLPSDATGLVTGPWHKASELDIKVTEGDAAAMTALSPYPAFPRRSNRSTWNVCKNETLRAREFR